ncbi:hypothetical protein B0H10DRAFT_2034435 [Mycena sp. CBHHK59/15]|nr:hypothetical protein B0H10DRAFT_2034435 [Mycena sp. CBHHK59/15]
MSAETIARVSVSALRRRIHMLGGASARSLASTDTLTVRSDFIGAGPAEDAFTSPATSYEYDECDDEIEEEVSDGGGETAELNYEEELSDPPAPPAWYQPSLPVLAALAPPIGNWLTGGDHVKDLMLLLLLVFYLHQVIEVPWALYHAARPHAPASPTASGAPTRAAACAQSALRRLELALLLLCLLAPLLGAALLRALTSLTADPTAPPISWFSITLFVLLTALRPLRELVSLLSHHTSTLHAHVHAHTAPPEFAETLSARVAQLERAVQDAQRRAEEAAAYVESAVAPLEHDVRRVERRVGKLRAGAKARGRRSQGDAAVVGQHTASQWDAHTHPHTTFIPAPARPHASPLRALLAWFADAPPADEPHKPVMEVPRPRYLHSIPEDDGEDAHTHAPAKSIPHTHAPPPPTLYANTSTTYARAHPTLRGLVFWLLRVVRFFVWKS